MTNDVPDLATIGGGTSSDFTPDPSQIDPDVIRTIYGEGDPAMIASVLANRKAKSGRDYADLITDPSQFEARTGKDWIERNSKLSTDSPEYQRTLQIAGPILSGHRPPIAPVDSFYGPKLQTSLGRPKPSWDDGSGVAGSDGNLYFSGKYQTGDTPPPDLASIGASTVPTQPKPGEPGFVDPIAAADTAVKANASQDKPSWPVYDPYNHVGRNADGSIAYVGGEDQEPTVDPETGLKNITFNRSSHPQTIADWLKAHPDDPGNKPQIAAPDTVDDLTKGLGQGVLNVGHSIESLKTLPVIGAALRAPGESLGSVQADLAQGVINRNTNDVNLNGSNNYNIGKFGGEVGATLPAMALTGGAAGLGDAALAGSKFAPAADFLAGRTGGNLLLRGASLATHGALQGAEAAGLTSAGSTTSILQQIGQGALTGGLITPGLHGAIEGGAGLINRFAPTVSQPISDLADKAINKFGINLRSSQILGAVDPRARLLDSELTTSPGSDYYKSATEQPLQFTKAVAGTFGVSPKDAEAGLTPAVMSQAKQRIGGVMNRVAASTNITDTPTLLTNLNKVLADADGVLGRDDMSKLLKQARNIRDTIDSTGLSGESYQGLTGTGSQLSRLQKLTPGKNSDVSFYANQIRNVLDDSLEAHVSNPQDLLDFKNARLQYKNMMTVKNLAAKAGVEGTITPSHLQGVVNRSFSNSAFTGAGDLGDLANIGQHFMKPPPDTKTAARLASKLTGLGVGATAIAEAAGPLFHDPLLGAQVLGGAVALAGAKYGVNRVSGALHNNSFLTNRFLQGPGASVGVSPDLINSINNLAVPTTVVGRNQNDNQFNVPTRGSR